MTSAVIVILSILSLTVLSAIGKYISYRNGKKSERLKNAEQTLKDVQKAKEAHNRIIYDDDYRERVREKFK